MKITSLSVPTPFYVGDVNVYLIREDPVTLIDVGPKTREAAEVLRRKLAAEGVLFSDVRRIVLTHAHEDHCGLAVRSAMRQRMPKYSSTTGRQAIFSAGLPARSTSGC